MRNDIDTSISIDVESDLVMVIRIDIVSTCPRESDSRNESHACQGSHPLATCPMNFLRPYQHAYGCHRCYSSSNSDAVRKHMWRSEKKNIWSTGRLNAMWTSSNTFATILLVRKFDQTEKKRTWMRSDFEDAAQVVPMKAEQGQTWRTVVDALLGFLRFRIKEKFAVQVSREDRGRWLVKRSRYGSVLRPDGRRIRWTRMMTIFRDMECMTSF